MRLQSIALLSAIGFALASNNLSAEEAGARRAASRFLRFNAATIDTTTERNLKQSPLDATVADRTYVVQFDRPLSATRRGRLERLGFRIGDYLTDTAHAARLNGAAARRLGAEADVRWFGPFEKSWKRDPELGRRAFLTPQRQNLAAIGQSRVVITLFAGRPAAPALATIHAVPGARVNYTELVAGNQTLVATLPSASVADLADLDDVQYIEEAPELTLRNNTTRWIVQTNVPGVTPFYSNGITGTGQIIGIMDSRVDSNHCAFLDAVNPIGPLHRKILAYNASLGAATHGTFVCGILTGDAGADDNNRGVAHGAKLVYNSHSTAFSETGVYTLLDLHHDQGARVHTNSWGNDATTAYDGLCRGIDAFSYDNEDDLVLFAVTNSSTLKNPENAKNLLAVAGTGDDPNQDWHCRGGTGPTADGRRKPEIYATACAVSSAQSSTTCGVQTLSVGSGGTSYACPAVAGAAVLMRQYFVEGFHPTGAATPADSLIPSGALLKACLINSSVDMIGLAGYPGILEGWGRVMLGNVGYFPGDSRRLHVVADVRNAVGLNDTQELNFQFAVNGSSEQLRVTLVWTEPPASASTGTDSAVVNDLDLEVTTPAAVMYLGNVFSGGVSATGGTADDKNNVEQVHLLAPAPGIWSAKVKGTKIVVGNQGFALIATGQAGPALPPPTVVSITPNAGDTDDYVIVTNLAGTGFQTGATVKLKRTGYPDIPADGATVVNSTQITTGFDLTAAAVGTWDVVVTNPELQSGTLANGFSVTVTCTKGDINNDTFVDGSDIQRFVDILLGGGGTARENCAGDLAPLRDNLVGEDDVDNFVGCILSAACL